MIVQITMIFRRLDVGSKSAGASRRHWAGSAKACAKSAYLPTCHHSLKVYLQIVFDPFFTSDTSRVYVKIGLL